MDNVAYRYEGLRAFTSRIVYFIVAYYFVYNVKSAKSLKDDFLFPIAFFLFFFILLTYEPKLFYKR